VPDPGMRFRDGQPWLTTRARRRNRGADDTRQSASPVKYPPSTHSQRRARAAAWAAAVAVDPARRLPSPVGGGIGPEGEPAVASTAGRGCAPPLGLFRLPLILPAVRHRPSVVHWRGFLADDQARGLRLPVGVADRCLGCWGCRRSCPAVCRRLSVVRGRAFSQAGRTKQASGSAGWGRSTRRQCVWVPARTEGGGLDGRPGPWPSRAERRQLRRSRAGGRLRPPAG